MRSLPSRFAIYADAIPWFPDEAVIRRASSCDAEILLMAPRSLKEPVSWKFSALKRILELWGLPTVLAGRRGVR